MALLQANYFSNVLRAGCSMNVILPQTGKNGFEAGPRYNKEGKIPVLWLLHGMGDDRTYWQRFTSVERYAEKLGIVVVMPEVLNQCAYTDMKYGLKWLTFITQELPQICKELFPQISMAKEDNFIAGLSMGGYGALKIGLLFPERFSAVGCFSMGNIVDIHTSDVDCSTEEWKDMSRTIATMPQNTFGTQTFRDNMNTESDLYYLLEQNAGLNKDIPRIFHCCGTEDALLPVAVRFKDAMKKYPQYFSKYEYHESAGAHVWSFWDAWLPEYLRFAFKE